MLVKQRIVLSLVFSLFIVSGYNAQNSSKNERDNPSTFLNLSFENASQSGQALCWYQWGDGFKVKVDTTVSHEGLKSMRIQKISSGQFGATSANFPINDAKGKHLRYTGYIKTKDITNGYAGLWWRVDGKIQGKILGFDNMAGRGATGTSDWKQYSIEMDIDTSAQNIVFGVIMPGTARHV
jgi:erythromycin esterase